MGTLGTSCGVIEDIPWGYCGYPMGSLRSSYGDIEDLNGAVGDLSGVIEDLNGNTGDIVWGH